MEFVEEPTNERPVLDCMDCGAIIENGRVIGQRRNGFDEKSETVLFV